MEEKVSAHESVKKMYERVHSEELTNVVDRFEAQQPTRCPFCSRGLSCNYAATVHAESQTKRIVECAE